jgi:phosphatidylglycerol:prolipoprotein diacylglycerol transferase
MHPVLFQFGPLVIPSYGAIAGLGIILSLTLAQVTAKRTGLDPRHAWNMLVLAVFASIAASRLTLIVLNLSDLRRHPTWLLSVAMVHHPLLAAIGALAAAVAVLAYCRWAKLRVLSVFDCLSAPIALGSAFEQVGALLAGSDFGRDSESSSRLFAITYTSPLAARWSGTPLGVPLYPVQAYAAVGSLLLAIVLVLFLRASRRVGDVAGIWLLGTGALLFLTELFRDWEGRGVLPTGDLLPRDSMDTPQLVGLGLVLAGGFLLFNWRPGSLANDAAHKEPHV